MRFVKTFGLALIAATVAACATGPHSARRYFDASSALEHPIVYPVGNKPRLAVAGILRRDALAAERRETTYEKDGSALRSLLASVSNALKINPDLQPSIPEELPLVITCPPAESTQRNSAGEPCVFPSRLDEDTRTGRLATAGFSHLVLIAVEVSKDNRGKETTWGMGPGIPMFTTETTVLHTFKVTAHVYVLASGEHLSEATAYDGDSGAYGVMMIIYPYYIAPSEPRYLEALGEAVGAELGLRFRPAGSRPVD